jgi:hypothetical protein
MVVGLVNMRFDQDNLGLSWSTKGGRRRQRTLKNTDEGVWGRRGRQGRWERASDYCYTEDTIETNTMRLELVRQGFQLVRLCCGRLSYG